MSYCRIILNALILLLITPGLAIHTPLEINTPIESLEEELDAYAQMSQGLPITYDGFLKLLHDIENDELEKRYDLEDLDHINHFLISCARQGLLPSDDAEELEADIEELLSHNASSELSLWIDDDYSIAPARLNGSFQTLLCKSFLQKLWKDTKKWVKKHKKPLIITAAAATAAALTFGIAGAVTAAAAGAASSVGDSSDHKEAKDSTIPFPSNGSSKEPPLIKSIYENELLSFKELIDREEFLDPKNTSFSLEEDGRVLRVAFIHQSLDVFQKEAASNPEFHRELHHIRQSNYPGSNETVFSMNGFTYPIAKPSKGFDRHLYQIKDS